MADERARGVDVEDGGGATPPIQGVATDIAGFVGVTERGPTSPTLVASWTEFEGTFGGFIDRPPFATPYWRLPYAVRGFFENGGRHLYVARVLDPMQPGTPEDVDAVAGDPAAGTGIHGLMAIPDISLMAVPDEVVAPAFADAVLDRCEAAHDRIALVTDTSGPSDPRAVAPHRDTAFGALYYPRLHVPAAHLPIGYAVVPPCGHVAGCLARVAIASGARGSDAELASVSLIGTGHASGVGPLDHSVSPSDAVWLASRGVNAIRDFRHAGRGVRVWGARTMSSDPEWKYVHVRRLVVYLEHSIDRGTPWVAFEPNTEPTWAAMRAAVTDFLRTRWRDGALVGATENKAFFVRCDRATMTQDDIDNGRLVCHVGVAPLRPTEFVIIRIGRWTAEAQR